LTEARLAFNKLNVGETLQISTDSFKAMLTIPEFFRDEGQSVLRVEEPKEDRWEIYIRKEK
jgi:TusA-related sulfurtransferase